MKWNKPENDSIVDGCIWCIRGRRLEKMRIVAAATAGGCCRIAFSYRPSSALDVCCTLHSAHTQTQRTWQFCVFVCLFNQIKIHSNARIVCAPKHGWRSCFFFVVVVIVGVLHITRQNKTYKYYMNWAIIFLFLCFALLFVWCAMQFWACNDASPLSRALCDGQTMNAAPTRSVRRRKRGQTKKWQNCCRMLLSLWGVSFFFFGSVPLPMGRMWYQNENGFNQKALLISNWVCFRFHRVIHIAIDCRVCLRIIAISWHSMLWILIGTISHSLVSPSACTPNPIINRNR